MNGVYNNCTFSNFTVTNHRCEAQTPKTPAHYSSPSTVCKPVRQVQHSVSIPASSANEEYRLWRLANLPKNPPYSCQVHDKIYKSKGSLKRHLEDYCHGEKLSKCAWCSYKTHRYDNLEAHMSSRHPSLI